MPIAMIVAMDRNRAIGVRNELPWRLPAEMAHFKQTTTGKTVLMGRKTFESLGCRPLPNRLNVILTRTADACFAGCEVVHSSEEAVAKYGKDELVIIGGAEVYSLFLPYADTLYVTDVDVEIADGDAFFPLFSSEEWELESSRFREADERNVYSFTIHTYRRKARNY